MRAPYAYFTLMCHIWYFLMWRYLTNSIIYSIMLCVQIMAVIRKRVNVCDVILTRSDAYTYLRMAGLHGDTAQMVPGRA